MARSMIQRRQDAERERIAAYEATLRARARQAQCFSPLSEAIAAVRVGLSSAMLRDPGEWRPQLKTRDPARLRLAAARYLFARYPVPAPLEHVWSGPAGLEVSDVKERKRWYLVAAQGGSLYKECAKDWLSRKEVHAFLNPPAELSFEAALWQAIARSYTDDVGVALRIARSKIAATQRTQKAHVFWREVARFFCVHPLPLEEIDDLCDFLSARFRADRRYSLKGRTPASLQRQMREWHRELAQLDQIRRMAQRHAAQARRPLANGDGKSSDGGRWQGAALADWSWQPSTKEAPHRREEILMVQLKTGADLLTESRAMHHCVSGYAYKCLTGNASIWSLRRRVAGAVERLLTIELDRQHVAIQIRGFANRLARPEEDQMLKRWAKARGVTLR
ncbi:PcfJ domain-containing protein [Labrys sp. La1]|uniref:PcfJ domain-containing protein n=1 Tax=Labrys sp. La1 TaxID=3404917 RepID=UPI003EB84308